MPRCKRSHALLCCWIAGLLLALRAPAQTSTSIAEAADAARQWVAAPQQAELFHAYETAAEIHHRVYDQPRPLQVWVVTIDLATPGLRFALTEPAAAAPDRGRFETRCCNTLEFARQRGVQLAINTSAFGPFRPSAGGYMDVVGLAAVRGNLYSPAYEGYGAMYIARDGHVALKGPPLPSDQLWHVVPGFRLLLDDRRIVVDPAVADSSFGGVNPRTAVGTDASGGTLWIVVVDGRQPGVSAGITLVELAVLFEHLGAWDALNLDGGGSTTLVIEQADGTHRTLNTPVGDRVPNTLRQVANNLGFYLPGPRPPAPDTPPATLRDTVIRLANSRRGGGRAPAAAGESTDITYDGQTLLRANPAGIDGCGATFELFLDAYCRARCHRERSAVEGRWLEGWPADTFSAFQQGWYGAPAATASPQFPEALRASIRERRLADVLCWARLGEPVSDYRLLERGDFVQFWRTGGGGHSALFWGRDYENDGRERLWYWSSRPEPRCAGPDEPGVPPATRTGRGLHGEYIGPEIDPARIYGVRLVEPAHSSTSQASATQPGQ